MQGRYASNFPLRQAQSWTASSWAQLNSEEDFINANLIRWY